MLQRVKSLRLDKNYLLFNNSSGANVKGIFDTPGNESLHGYKRPAACINTLVKSASTFYSVALPRISLNISATPR